MGPIARPRVHPELQLSAAARRSTGRVRLVQGSDDGKSAELEPQPPELEAAPDRALVLTVTDLEDADPGPEAHDAVQAFLDAVAAAVVARVRAGGKVLVCCRVSGYIPAGYVP